MTPPEPAAAGVDPHAGGEHVSYALLTFALMGGAVMWLLRLIANTALVSASCEVGSTWPLWVTSAVATLLAGAPLAASWRYLRTGAADTVRWLGLLGVMFNVLAIAGIVLETVPVAVLHVCPGAAG